MLGQDKRYSGVFPMLQFNNENNSSNSKKTDETVSYNLDKKTSNNVSYNAEDKINNGANDYVKKVCDQIRWKKAHNSISEELLEHIKDQKYAFIKKGQNKEDAEKNAILEMGDAVTVGQQLDRTHRPKPDFGLLAIVGVCILISLVLQYFISLNVAENDWQLQGYFYNYLKVLPIGIGVMFAIYFVDYSIIGKFPQIIYGVLLAVCVLLFNFDSLEINYSYPHVYYFVAFMIPIYAAIVYKQRGKGYLGLLYCGAVGVISCIIFRMSSLLGVWIFSICGSVILTKAIKKDWFQVKKKLALILVWVPVTVVISLPFIFCFRRFAFIFITTGNEYGSAYLLKMVRGFLSNAKLLGQGKWPSYLPEGNAIEGILPSWYADYSLTYTIYKFGWIVAIVAIMVSVFLIIRLFKIVHKQSSQLGYIVSFGVFISIVAESVIFLFSNLGLCGWASHPLPLISPGNISFVVNMGLMGLILSVYKNNSIVRDSRIQAKSAGYFGTFCIGQHRLKIGKWQVVLKKLK